MSATEEKKIGECVQCYAEIESIKQLQRSGGHYWCGECGGAIDTKDGEDLPTPPDRSIEEAIEAATEEFWYEVANSFPSIKTGDFPPDADSQFRRACENAVRSWLAFNKAVADFKEKSNAKPFSGTGG